MRICVLGTGSIGGLILGALCSTEHDLVAVSRGETAMRLSTEGLVIHRHDGPIEMIPSTRFSVIDTEVQETMQGNIENSDFAIICGKSGERTTWQNSRPNSSHQRGSRSPYRMVWETMRP